ncbi:hypothetical protein F5884DRAFT_767184 [Xylogone sp. PMI_703]|nr:hypothetical protein F5884DRAFT_767184 [Xylogone sp. PMI_703]
MGIPYSKQINLAFDQVTPLVAHGFQVLKTTRNITFLLAAIQVLTAVCLGLILVALLGLLITVSPDLEDERRALVTPVVKWLAAIVLEHGVWVKVYVRVVAVGVTIGTAAALYVTREREKVEISVEGAGQDVEGDEAPS